MAEAPDILTLEYAQINENIRFLADVRFKLLAVVPLLGGAAAFVLSQRVGLQAGESLTAARYDLLIVVAFSTLGFLATLGITLYDQRNSELYNALIHRAKYLERRFTLESAPGGIKSVDLGRRPPHGGQYSERPGKHRSLIFKAGHDLSLALIYGSLLGAWIFPISYGIARMSGLSHRYALTAAVLLAVAAAAGFITRMGMLDANDRALYHNAAELDGLEDS